MNRAGANSSEEEFVTARDSCVLVRESIGNIKWAKKTAWRLHPKAQPCLT